MQEATRTKFLQFPLIKPFVEVFRWSQSLIYPGPNCVASTVLLISAFVEAKLLFFTLHVDFHLPSHKEIPGSQLVSWEMKMDYHAFPPGLAPATCIAILIEEHVLDPQLLKAERMFCFWLEHHTIAKFTSRMYYTYPCNHLSVINCALLISHVIAACLVSHWLARIGLKQRRPAYAIFTWRLELMTKFVTFNSICHISAILFFFIHSHMYLKLPSFASQ